MIFNFMYILLFLFHWTRGHPPTMDVEEFATVEDVTRTTPVHNFDPVRSCAQGAKPKVLL